MQFKELPVVPYDCVVPTESKKSAIFRTAASYLIWKALRNAGKHKVEVAFTWPNQKENKD